MLKKTIVVLAVLGSCLALSACQATKKVFTYQINGVITEDSNSSDDWEVFLENGEKVIANKKVKEEIVIGDEVLVDYYKHVTLFGDKTKGETYEIVSKVEKQINTFEHNDENLMDVVNKASEEHGIDLENLSEISLPDFIDTYMLEDLEITDGYVYFPKEHGDYTTLIVLKTPEPEKLEATFEEIRYVISSSFNNEEAVKSVKAHTRIVDDVVTFVLQLEN